MTTHLLRLLIFGDELATISVVRGIVCMLMYYAAESMYDDALWFTLGLWSIASNKTLDYNLSRYSELDQSSLT